MPYFRRRMVYEIVTKQLLWLAVTSLGKSSVWFALSRLWGARKEQTPPVPVAAAAESVNVVNRTHEGTYILSASSHLITQINDAVWISRLPAPENCFWSSAGSITTMLLDVISALSALSRPTHAAFPVQTGTGSYIYMYAHWWACICMHALTESWSLPWITARHERTHLPRLTHCSTRVKVNQR